MDTLVSIIVPIYNAEKYIARCLDNLLLQTIGNFEIIAVNDGSQDNSLAILLDYAKKNKYIRVINQKNMGPSSARNKGILKAKGEYIGFVDVDDWIHENMYKEMFETAKRTKAELVMCNFMEEHEGGSNIYNSLPWKDGTILGKEEIDNSLIPHLIGLPYEYAPHNIIHGAVWRCLYKTEILKENNITFPEDLTFTEDLIFNLYFLKHIQSVAVCGKYFYHYVINKSSITQRYMPSMLASNLCAFSHLKQILGHKGFAEEYHEYIKWRWRLVAINCIVNVVRPGNEKGFFGKLADIEKIINVAEINRAFTRESISRMPFLKKVLYSCIRLKIKVPILIYYSFSIN